MRLPEFSVRRPVTTIMITLALILLGIISWQRLPQELFPAITYPQLTVVTTYENAAPEEVESLITKIIEDSVGTVPGLKYISSISKEGVSLVTVEFNWGTNMDFAALAVREKIDLMKQLLPIGAKEPIVMKFNPFSLPVMTLSVTGNKSQEELYEISRKLIKNEIEKVTGVASANITGGIERQILVEIDQGRLQASGVSILSVVEALSKTNLNYPAGTIKEDFYEYLIRTMGEFRLIAEIPLTAIEAKETISEEEKQRQLLTSETEGSSEKRLIVLRDLARVKDILKERTSYSRYNGRENISIAIQKQSGANTLHVAQRLKRQLEEVRAEVPKGVNIGIVYDQSNFIKKSISGVRNAALQGGILAFLILLLFLREFKLATIVITITPITILACFSLMYFENVTLNMISLGGIAIGVGMLIDNAIVVVESIYRHRRSGKTRDQAAIVGANEVVVPMFASTLTTISVFFPMIFIVGIAGQLFKELAWVIIVTQAIALIIAFMLIPCLVAIGRSRREENIAPEQSAVEVSSDEENPDSVTPTNRFLAFLGRPLDLIAPVYEKILEVFLRHKIIGLLLVLLIFIGSMSIFPKLDKEFLPKIDEGQFVLKVNLPSGTRLEVTNQTARKIEKTLFTLPELKDITVNVGSSMERALGAGVETLGSHQAQFIINLKRGERGMRPTDEVIVYLKSLFTKQDLKQAELEFIIQGSAFESALGGASPVVVEIKGRDLKKLDQISYDLEKKLSKVKGLYGIRTSAVTPSPETKVHILKDRATMYSLSVSDIALASQVAIKGYTATKFKTQEGREIDIRVRLRPEDRSNFYKLREILIYSAALKMNIPLAELAYIKQGTGPTEIRHDDQQRIIMLSANVYKRAFKEIVADIDKIILSTKVPNEYSVELTGENLRMQESFKSLRFALILAIILVYMIMASQFESLWQPFIIMFTMPLSLIGIIWTLYLTHTPVSVVVLLGVIMQGGIVVNNGIILIDYTNRLRKMGLSPEEAMIRASKVRLRPILMTALTSILALLPLSLGLAEGSELDAPLARTTMGGLFAATFLTLLVLPALYLVSEKVIGFVLGKQPEVIPLPQPKLTAAPVKVEALPLPSLPLPEAEVKEKQPLNPRQNALIDYLSREKKITRIAYSKYFNVSIPTAARDLKEMVNRGLIVAKGPLGPGRWYEIKTE